MKIRGIPTGDGECWCFLVTRHTFRKVTGQYPSKYDRHKRLYGQAGSGPYMYRLSPGHLIGFFRSDQIVDLEISAIVVGPVKKGRKAR